MHTHIIRDIINLDKTAREKIKSLEKEKESLDENVKQEEKILRKQIDEEIKFRVKSENEKYLKEIKKREVDQLTQYNDSLKFIQKKYEENKTEWVNTIFDNCTK